MQQGNSSLCVLVGSECANRAALVATSDASTAVNAAAGIFTCSGHASVNTTPPPAQVATLGSRAVALAVRLRQCVSAQEKRDHQQCASYPD